MTDIVFERWGPGDASDAGNGTTFERWGYGNDKPEASPISTDDVVRSLARGVPIIGGLADKANAATYAALSPLLPGDTTVSQAPNFSDRYNENLQRERSRDQRYADEHPVANIAGEFAGGVGATIPAAATVTGAKLLGLTGTTLPRQIAAGAASGAGIGMVDAGVRDHDPTAGAGWGGVAGMAGPLVGRALGAGARGVRDLFTDRPTVPVTDPNFGVPLSRGQQLGDFDTIMMEQAARRGGMGQRPQQIAEDFFQGQRDATDAARTGIGADLGGGRVVADNPQTAGELVSEGVRARAAEARAGYRGLYDQVAEMPGTIERGAFDRIGDSIRQRLTLGDHPVIIDDRNTPFAARALADIEQQIGGTRYQNRAAPDSMRTETFPPHAVDGVGLSDLDQARKRLVSFYTDAKGASAPGTFSADMRATRGIIGALDDHIEQAVNSGLFRGDERALPTLRAARAANSEYRKTFTPQGPGDEAGRVVQQILGRFDGQAASPTQISNWLYGASGIGNTGTAVKVAQRLRTILGDDSQAWTGVRQGLWSKLTGATEGRTDWGPQRISERIYEVLNGGGRPLSQVLFNPEERARMAQFAGLLKQLVPPPGAVNHSNTAPVLARLAAQSLNGITAMLGFHAAGPVGGLAGYAANAARKGLQERAAANRITNSLYGSIDRDALVRAALTRAANAGGLLSRAAIPATNTEPR